MKPSLGRSGMKGNINITLDEIAKVFTRESTPCWRKHVPEVMRSGQKEQMKAERERAEKKKKIVLNSRDTIERTIGRVPSLSKRINSDDIESRNYEGRSPRFIHPRRRKALARDILFTFWSSLALFHTKNAQSQIRSSGKRNEKNFAVEQSSTIVLRSLLCRQLCSSFFFFLAILSVIRASVQKPR